MDPDKHLNEIERFPVVEEEARRFCSNRPFFEMGFGLLSEITELAWLCSLIRRSAAWQVNKAIVGGNTVRLVKLSRSLLQATRDHQAELGWVVMRMLVETAVNVRFLVQEDSEELFRAYLDYSLAHEIKLEARDSMQCRGAGSRASHRNEDAEIYCLDLSQIWRQTIPGRRPEGALGSAIH